jgi:hypothetical protein
MLDHDVPHGFSVALQVHDLGDGGAVGLHYRADGSLAGIFSTFLQAGCPSRSVGCSSDLTKRWAWELFFTP